MALLTLVLVSNELIIMRAVLDMLYQTLKVMEDNLCDQATVDLDVAISRSSGTWKWRLMTAYWSP